MPNDDSKPILTQTEPISQDEVEISCGDRGLRILAQMIARKLILRREDNETVEKINDLPQKRDNR